MLNNRPYVLTIAGFDPCSGAGISADLKTFEQHKVYGLAIVTGWTLQTEKEFFSIEWRKLEELQKELDVLLENYTVAVVKFGIVPSLKWLDTLTQHIHQKNKNIAIVIDPIWKSSSGFTFSAINNLAVLNHILEHTTLLTPNTNELAFMAGDKNTTTFLKNLALRTNILLKGGHSISNVGTDVLYLQGQEIPLTPIEKNISAKHGSGCVLSAAIAANLALGNDLTTACKKAKAYTERFLASNTSLLGYHA